MTADEPRTHRRAVSYIDKSREFYAAQGYEQAYRWASHGTVPFTGPVDLESATVSIVTTAFRGGHIGRKDAYADPTSPVPTVMSTADLSWDREATHTDDVGSFLPLAALHDLAGAGVIGRVADRFYGVPTLYSHRATQRDAERVVEWATEDDVDLLLLTPL